MNEMGSASASIRLGLQCQALRRFDEAEKHFRAALSDDPNNGQALHFLAASIHAQNERKNEALRVADQAISADPNDALHHALRAFILNDLDRPRDALNSAKTARELDPTCEAALIGEAQAFIQLCDWKNAERAARSALQIDADSANAANLLALSLRQQRKLEENREQISGLLERDPENAYTHYNAGWSALHENDHRTAERHFREALRINPEFEPAREGLLTSFRARSPLYRGYLWYCIQMSRLNRQARFAVIFGLFLFFRLARSMTQTISPTVAAGIGIIYFLFVLWSFVATAVGNLILLFDSFAKHALRANEKIEAVVVGGGIVTGVCLLLTGMGFHFTLVLLAGAALIVSAIPFSLTFRNKAVLGKWLFGVLGIAILATALVAVCTYFLADEQLFQQILTILAGLCLAGLLSTWLSGVRALRR